MFLLYDTQKVIRMAERTPPSGYGASYWQQPVDSYGQAAFEGSYMQAGKYDPINA